MNRTERVRAALSGERVDHVPISVWSHYSECDQDPKSLAEKHVALQQEWGLDFIKLTPFGYFTAQDWGCQLQFFCKDGQGPTVRKHAISSAKEWEHLEVLPPYFGNWGKQLLLTRYTIDLVKQEVPVLQTVFSPLTTARKLAGDRIFDDMRNAPATFHKALRVITDTTIGFVRETLKLGAAGIFFGNGCVSRDLMSSSEFAEFARAYDLQVLEVANRGGWFNTLHIHGESTRFDELADYPVHALNWPDRRGAPTLREARSLTAKCFVGGINEKGVITNGTPSEVGAEVTDAIRQTEMRGLMLGPGCVIDPRTPSANVLAAVNAARAYSG